MQRELPQTVPRGDPAVLTRTIEAAWASVGMPAPIATATPQLSRRAARPMSAPSAPVVLAPPPISAQVRVPIAMPRVQSTTEDIDKCVLLMVRVLTRTTEQIVNPMTNITSRIVPELSTFTRLRRRCASHGSDSVYRTLVLMVQEELRREVAWSPYAQAHRGNYSTTGNAIPILTRLVPNIYMREQEVAARAAVSLERERHAPIIRPVTAQPATGTPHISPHTGRLVAPAAARPAQPLVAPAAARPAQPLVAPAAARPVSRTPSRSPEFGEDSPSPGTSNQSCKALLNDIRREGNVFKGFANKLLKMCTKIHDDSMCTSEIFENVLRNLHRIYDNSNTTFKFKTVDEGYELNGILELGGDSDRFKRMFTTPFYSGTRINFKVEYNNRRGEVDRMLLDAGGPIRQFFSNIAKQMLESAYFKKVGDSYTLNPDGNHAIETFERLGCITAFLMLNEFKFEHHLSRSLLASLLYKPDEIYPDDFALYHILDYPSLANLMKEPDTIQYVGLELENGTEVTKANFRQYLQEQGRPNQRCVNAFRKGFFISSSSLRRNSVSLLHLDTLLTGSEISLESIRKILTKLNRNVNGSRSPCLNNFIYILESPAEAYPRISASQGHLPKSKSEFMKKLLFFWTGVRTYNDRLNYSMMPTTGVHFVGHTCGASIEIPVAFYGQDATTRERMYRQLIATVSVEGGFAFR